MKFLKFIYLLSISILFFTSCTSALNADDDYNKGYKQGFQDGFNAVNKTDNSATHAEQHNDPNTNYVKPSDDASDDDSNASNSDIPQKVYKTLTYIQQNNRAPDGYVGGRHFGNFEHHLPERDAAGNAIDYKEYDVNPKIEGKNRGTQRLVVGSDGRAWYTNDHYKSFVEVK